MKDQSVDYQKLEFAIHSESSEQRKSSFISKIARIWNRIVESVTAANEPKIYSFKNRSGSSYWAINDPLSGHRVFFESEVEVRKWLDCVSRSAKGDCCYYE